MTPGSGRRLASGHTQKPDGSIATWENYQGESKIDRLINRYIDR